MFQTTFSVPLSSGGDKRNKGINLPDWIQIFPPGREIEAADKRKIKLGKIDQLVANFRARQMVPLDFKHASLSIPYETRLEQPQIRPVDVGDDESAGWITDLDVSDLDTDGVWAKVEWTPKGAEAVMSKKFRFASPELIQDEDFEAVHLLSAGLVKEHALTGLQAIYSVQREENNMDKIATALGVAPSEDAVLAKITELTRRLTELEEASVEKEQTVATTVASLESRIAAREAEIAAKEKQMVEKEIDQELHIACHVEKKITPGELSKYKKICIDSGLPFFRELIGGKAKLIPEGPISTFSVEKTPGNDAQLTPRQKEVARQYRLTDQQYLEKMKKQQGEG